MSDRLENLFNKASGPLNLVKEVTGQVRSGPLAPQEKEFTVTKTGIASLPISVSGKLLASAQIHGVDQAVRIFEFDNPEAAPSSPPIISLPVLPGTESKPEEAKPPPGTAFSELVIFIGAQATAKLKSPASQALAISAGASASGSLRYRLLLPAAGTALRVAAIGKLLAGARPPQLVDLADLVPGELHTFDGRLQLGFDLKTEMGKRFDFSREIDLFDQVSPTFSANAEATLSASLGWSLYDRLQMAVGKVNVGADGDSWVRVRFQRLRRRELTLGAKLAVQVEYDLGQKTFKALLDRILGIEPLERLFDGLDEVEKLGLHTITDEAGWIGKRDQLSERLGEVVLEYVDVDSAIDRLPFDKVQPFLDDIAEVVARYRGLDQKIQSLVRSTLGRIDLGAGSKLRTALDQIAALDPSDLDSALDRIISPDFQQAVDLLELLSGSNVEEMLLGSRASQAVQEAAALAAQATQFLDGLGADAVSRLHAFTQKNGIDSVVAWLEENATSTQKLKGGLKNRASSKIRGLVTRLTNKAWDRLDTEDFARIKRLSATLVELEDKREEVEAKLNKAVEALKGEAGFSVGIEISRLTERAAILDLEVDSANERIRKATEEALVGLEARELLDTLSKTKDEGDDPGYRLRDSVFSYRRVRSSAFSSFFSFLGIKRARTTIRVDEEVVRVVDVAGKERQATYSSGTVRRLTDGSKDALAGSHELGTWLTSRYVGPGLDLDAPYSDVVERGLRVVYSRADNKTRPEELEALGQLMADIGFADIGGMPVGGEIAPADAAAHTEFSFSIEFGGTAVSALLQNKTPGPWQTDYRNAAHRWLDDELIPVKDRIASGSPRPRKGRLLSRVLQDPRFGPALPLGTTFYDKISKASWNVDLDGTTYRVPIKVKDKLGRYPALNEVLFRFGPAKRKMEQTVTLHKTASADLKPADLRLFGKKFATLLKRTPFSGWPSPLFNLWLTLTRVARQDAGALAEARGLATLRYRADSEEEWQVRRWELKGANSGVDIFPFG